MGMRYILYIETIMISTIYGLVLVTLMRPFRR